MATSTIAPIVGVDPALQLAFNENPDVSFYQPFIDSALDADEELVADVLRWLWDKERLPYDFWDYVCGTDFGGTNL